MTASSNRKIVRRSKPASSERKVVVRRSGSAKQSGIKVKTKKRVRSKDWHPEAALLSTMIETRTFQDVIDAGVTKDWFHAYSDEWEYMERFLNRHKSCPTRKAWVRKFPDFDWQDAEDVKYLVEEVRQSHTRHALLMAIAETTDNIRGGLDPTEALSIVERRVMTVHTQVTGAGNKQSDLTEDWLDTYHEVSARVGRASSQGTSGITTGFPTLDLATGGIDEGHYWVVAARLKGGKTWMAAQIACSAIIQGHTVLYYSLEMPRRQMEMRFHNLLSSKFGQEVFRSVDLMQGRGFDLLRYKKFLSRMSKELSGRLIIDDSGGRRLTPLAIGAAMEQHRPRMVVVDYLTLMSPSMDWQAIAETSIGLKSLCGDYPFASIVAAAQVNRAGAGKEPPSADELAGSDGIGRDLDALVTMASQSQRVKKMMLANFRHGPDRQKWWTSLDLNRGTFKEISGNDAQDLIDEDEENASKALD
jgi:replicative DNA helicase